MRSIILALVAGTASVLVYLAVVVLTSPNVPASYAIRAALTTNSLFILGLSAGYALFFYTSDLLKARGCRIKSAKGARIGTGASGFAAVISYLGLTHFGCCGFWIYILSLLPSFIGVGGSALLIEYRDVFAALALIPIYYVTATRIKLLMRSPQLDTASS